MFESPGRVPISTCGNTDSVSLPRRLKQRYAHFASWRQQQLSQNPVISLPLSEARATKTEAACQDKAGVQNQRKPWEPASLRKWIKDRCHHCFNQRSGICKSSRLPSSMCLATQEEAMHRQGKKARSVNSSLQVRVGFLTKSSPGTVAGLIVCVFHHAQMQAPTQP